MDVVVKLPATATTVTVTVAAAAPPSSSAVRLVALLAAFSVFYDRAFRYILYYLHVVCNKAAATRLALLLPSRRRWLRHGVAFVVLAAASLGHCLCATVVRIVLADDPVGYLFYRICCAAFIFLLAVGDILSFIALILLGDEKQAAA